MIAYGRETWKRPWNTVTMFFCGVAADCRKWMWRGRAGHGTGCVNAGKDADMVLEAADRKPFHEPTGLPIRRSERHP